MTKVFFALISILIFIGAHYASAMSVQDVKVEQKGAETKFILEFDEEVELKPTMLGETVAIALPSNLKWDAPFFMNKPKGLIQNFAVHHGELIIYLQPGTSLVKSSLLDRNIGKSRMALTFKPGSPLTPSKFIEKRITTKETDQFVVKSIRVGKEGDKMRLVFDLNKPLKLEPQHLGDKIVVPVAANATWASAPFKKQGLIKDVNLADQEDGSKAIEIHILPGTQIHNHFSLTGDKPRYVMDLIPASSDIVPVDITPASSLISLPVSDSITLSSHGGEKSKGVTEFLSQAEAASGIALHAPIPVMPGAWGQEGSDIPQGPQEVKSLKIEEHHKETKLILTLRKSEDFKVIQNEYTHQMMIYLPKLEWAKVHAHEKSGGLIENYYLDDTFKDNSVLILNVKPGAEIKRKEVNRHHHHHHKNAEFILTLSLDKNKEYNWGAGTEENWGRGITKPAEKRDASLAASLDEKREVREKVMQEHPFSYQTEKPYFDPKDNFKGGNTSFTSIGIGLYAGAQFTYAAGRNVISGQVSDDDKFNFNSSLDGPGGALFVGYGWGFHNFYVGLEATGQYLGLNSRTTVFDQDNAILASYKDRSWLTYGASVRLGAYFTPESLFTVRLGGVGTLLKHKTTDTSAGTHGIAKNLSQNLAGILYGFGIETALDTHWSTRIDYMHVDYQHITKTIPLSGGGTQQARMAPKLDQVLFGVAYKWDPMFGPDNPEDRDIIPTGAYIGTGANLSTFALNRSLTAGEKLGAKSASLDPQWNVYGGYGMLTGRLYLGAEAGMSLGTAFISESLTINGETGGYRARLSPSFTLALRPGFAFGHSNLIYGKFGGVMGHFTLTSSGTPGILSSGARVKKTLYGFSLGGGLESFINKNVSIRGEYIYEIFHSFKTSLDGYTDKFTPTTSKFQLGISYLF
jgi:opacity protein-like surface antigen